MKLLIRLLSLFVLAPFAALFWFAVHESSTDDLTFIGSVWPSLRSSIVYGLLSTLLAGLFGLLSAYHVSFTRLAGRRVVETLLVLPLLLPPFVVASVYRELFSASGPFGQYLPPSLIVPIDFQTPCGFIFVMSVSLFPYVYLLCRATFEHHGHAFLEIGQSTGLGRRRAVVKILLPLSLPALLLGTALVFMETVSDQATASALSVDVLSVALRDLWFERDQAALAARLSLSLVLVILVLVFLVDRVVTATRHRYLLKPSPNAVRVKAARSLSGMLVLAFCLLPAFLGFVLPVGALLALFFGTLDKVDLSTLVLESASTVGLVAFVCVVCILLSFLLTYTNQCFPDRVSRFVVRWVSLSYMIPAIVFSFGVLALAGEYLPFVERYGNLVSFLVLGIGLGLRFLCFVLIPMSVGISYLPRRLDEIAKSLQLGPASSFLRVHVPHLERFAFLGLLLVVIQTLKEATVSVILRPFGLQPIALKAYSLVRIDMLPESSGWVLALVLLGLYPLMTLERFASARHIRSGGR